MLDLNKIKRQIEIVGLCIRKGVPYKPVDLAVMYDCEELTIKRDLQELRSYGIPIHSTKSKGICLDEQFELAKIKQLIIQYVGISNAGNLFDKATNLVVRKLKEKSLTIIVTLQRCIETHTAAVIDYVKESDEEERGKEIWPLQLFQSDGYWRILAVNEGKIKQYHITKLKDVSATERKFKRPPQEEIDNLFKYSFRSWVGSEAFAVKLLLGKEWAGRVKPTQLMDTQRLTENEDGSVLLEATVNSLTELASWVVSRGEGVKVLEPVELKTKVIELARGVLKNYGTR